MKLTFDQNTLNYYWLQTAIHLEHEESRLLMQIYGVRVGALVVITGLWILLTLTSGFLTVAMVILIGAAVGNAHHLLGRTPRWAHHSSALLLTLCGGILANVLAGLALFSINMGVGYWQVITARRLPEDVPMLVSLFIESFRAEDGLFYALAVTVTIFSARHLNPWRKCFRKA